MRIAVGGFGGERKSLLGISLPEEKLCKIREGPVVVGAFIFDKLDRRPKAAGCFLIFPARFIAQAEIVVCLVRTGIDLQNTLELADSLINLALLVVDPAKHVGALLVVGVSVQQLDETILRCAHVAEKI